MINIDDFCELLNKTNQFDSLETKILKAMIVLEKKKMIKNSAITIAKEAKLSVTNAYKYLYMLQQKGIVESRDAKNKIFWLSHTNPFPRLFSQYIKDYIDKKEIYLKLQEFYEKTIPKAEPYLSEPLFENFSSINDFINKSAFLFDIAENEVLVSAERLIEDFMLLDAIKRAIERGIRIRVLIGSETAEEQIERIRKLGAEVKFTTYKMMQPYVMLVDNKHGLTLQILNEKNINGTWFLNQKSDFTKKFNEVWQRGGDI